MTKLTPEQVEKLEAQVKERCESDARDFLGIRLHRDDMQAILTLCREWRERGEALDKAICPKCSSDGPSAPCAYPSEGCPIQRDKQAAALKGGDHEDT